MTFNINDAAATFEAAVRGVSTTDPVLGGAAGEANMAATDLALRTKYLKAKLEALGAVGTWTEAQYTADGTFVVPAGVTQVLVVRAKGGGGGGAGNFGTLHPGGGGGEGAEVTMIPIAVTAGWTLDIDIGAGGAKGVGITGTYSSTVLGTAGADTTLKHGATTLLTVGGGLGGGITDGNADGPGSGVRPGSSVGGDGGSATVDGVTSRGAAGGDGEMSPGRIGGRGGGQGGGHAAADLNGATDRSAQAGLDGGGGGGGVEDVDSGDGAAGGNGSLRLGYWSFDITGNT